MQRLGAESLARLEQRLVEYGKSNVLELFEVRKKGSGGKGRERTGRPGEGAGWHCSRFTAESAAALRLRIVQL